MGGITIMWCVGSAAAGFLLGYFYRVGLENADGEVGEQQRGITIGPVPPGYRSGYPLNKPCSNPDAPLSREDRPPAPPESRSTKPRKPRRKR